MGSVGRGANLLLNVPVNREGLIGKEDSIRLMEFDQARKKMFVRNLATGATMMADGKRISQLNDNSTNSFWFPGKRVIMPVVDVVWNKPQKVNYIILRENIALGQRVQEFSIEIIRNGAFTEVAKGTTIGHKRIISIGGETTNKIRLSLKSAKAVPVLQEIEVY
jgi:alpha-L-fucosidase